MSASSARALFTSYFLVSSRIMPFETVHVPNRVVKISALYGHISITGCCCTVEIYITVQKIHFPRGNHHASHL